MKKVYLTLLSIFSLTFVSAFSESFVGALFLIFPFLLIMFVFMTIPTLLILAIVFWVFMLIDCVKRDFPKEDDKIVWIIVIALTNWIGALIYYFIVKRKDKKK